MSQRTREEVLQHIDEAVKSPAHGPGEEQRRIDLAVLETLLDIRDGVNRMLDSGMYESRLVHDPNQFDKPS